MRIEKIELIGFKSFAEKTTFHLHPGITCIVGPNGAGKSNIVDSFRWVLGEQSAKSLRGEKMEEVIFNGSATKKPRGMSEVNLILSFDTPEQGNGDSQTLTSVARRLYRSGESEYLINRTQCRLRDIKDLFLDTGLEIKSYSILEQGRIGEILNSKPQERRFLIEEVAGVMKYKVRKAEALSKLESSRLNLQRINDIVAEVKRQINSLDRQVKKAERFKKLSSELRAIELKIARRDYLVLQESLEKVIADHSVLKEEETLVRAELNTVENTRETKRIALLDKEKFLDTITTDLRGIEREIAESERAIAVSTTESNNLTEYLSKLAQQESDITLKIAGIENKKTELDTLEIELSTQIDSLRHELSEKQEAIRGLEGELAGKEEQIEAKRRDIFRTAEDLSSLRNQIGNFLTSVDNLEKRHMSLEKEAETAREHLTGIEADLNSTGESLAGKDSEHLLLNNQRAALVADIENSRATVEQTRHDIARVREDLASASSRLDSLREIMHEDVSAEGLVGYLPILASLAEILDVDEAYEKAIENALSEKLNGFIVQSSEPLAAAVPVLKEQRIRRAVFFPVTLAAPLTVDSQPPMNAGHDSILGNAADLVRISRDNELFSPLVQSLLNNVIVVKDLSTAFSLHRDSRCTFVTLDGETVEPSGAVTIGEGKGILKRKRELRELAAFIEQKKTEGEHLNEKLTAGEETFQGKKVSLKEIDAAIINLEKEISLLRLTAENQTAEKERIQRRLSYLAMEREEILKEKNSLQQVIAEQEAEGERIQASKAEAEQFVASMQDAIAKDKDRYEAERASISDLRVSLNSLKERRESLKKEIETSLEMLAELTQTQEALAKEKADIDLRILQCKEEVGNNTNTLKGLVLKADDLKRVISENRETIRIETEELVRLDQDSKIRRGRLESFMTAISEADVSMAEQRLRITNLAENTRQNYGIDISNSELEAVLPDDEERLSELRTKIQELGPVNLGTLDEYEELRTRYEFLSQQQEDLTKSIAELEEAITKINSTTRKKLREAFEQLNTKFSEVFTHLFGGGKAGLVMTDEQNILDSGLDIIAQPPGKKLQNINLLSGGEKALTALALLFASFLIKPSPLCILDEVDAALDESNIERFAKMLRELAAGIQFIVVTHSRTTMESADYLYGITMEEPGVSKVISMQLVDS